ncbi:secretion protein HlyD [Verrucomicrobiaceae bacterium SCGC AG-212-N21]|nr:secretion protein HlyD [Verrucomicrobiaceae bacterium SCGC AG-212-N21]
MNTETSHDIRGLRSVTTLLLLASLLCACQKRESDLIQGYAEGEFVYVASPHPGAVQKLSVQRGDRVEAGAPLFELDPEPQKTTRAEAERRLLQARANLEDAKKGRRPTEMDSLTAQLEQLKAAATYSARELARQEQLTSTGATSKEDVDRARSLDDQNKQRVAQAEADLNTGKLGLRSDQIDAAEAEARAREAALARAEWDLAQKRQNAPKAGLISDTLYREGEWVAAGRPVVVLLPPQNIKVRAFVPETRIGSIRVGQAAKVTVDGVPEPLAGKVSFVSPQAEYTPPVIYSRESRSKLVFMIELVFDPKVAETLHPGQPVDVQITP